MTQCFFFKHALMHTCLNIAKRHKDSIGRVIVAAVERLQLRVSQVRNMLWIAATVVVIGAGRKKVFAQCAPQRTANGTHRAFHFVEHDPLKD